MGDTGLASRDLERAAHSILLLPENLSQKQFDTFTVVAYPAHFLRPPCFSLFVYPFESTQAPERRTQSTFEVLFS